MHGMSSSQEVNLHTPLQQSTHDIHRGRRARKKVSFENANEFT